MYLDPRAMRVVLSVALVLVGLVWVGVENVGGVLAGGATDPNSGPLLVLLLLAYWPLTATPVATHRPPRPQRPARQTAPVAPSHAAGVVGD